MKNLLTILRQHIFIVLAGLAALPNSVFSISIIMQGPQPIFPSLHWWAWAFSGILLGLTIDVGMIVVSIQIARGEGTKMRLLAFCLLAMFNFYLQWYHAAAHVALLPFAAGMESQVNPFSLGLRDMGVWIVSLLPPLATIIYTFGYPRSTKPKETATVTQTKTTVTIERPAPHALQSSTELVQIEAPAQFTEHCDECEYEATKETRSRALAAVRFHKRARHKVNAEVNQGA